MKRIGILGAKGFLGRALCDESKKYEYEIIEIVRENYDKNKFEKYDIVINAATPSKKFWASKNPYQDFLETVSLTADLVYNWKYDKLIQISTMSVNQIDNHPYAINKKAAEVLTMYRKHLILRLSNLFGEGLNKGPLFDLLNSQRIYVDIESEYSFINTAFVSKWIFNNLDKNGQVQIGARDTISLLEITEKYGLNVKWEGKKEIIFSPDVEKGMPSVKAVSPFIEKILKKGF